MSSSSRPPASHILLAPAIQAIVAALGLGVAGWAIAVAITVDRLFATPSFMSVLTCSVALGLIGIFARSEWRECVAWAALSIVGHVTVLQLIEAGPAVRYQHLRPAVEGFTGEDRILLAAALVIGFTVILGLRPHMYGISAWLRQHLGLGRGLFLVLAFMALSASPLKDLRGYALEITISTGLAVMNLATVVLVVLHIPPSGSKRIERLIDRLLGPDDRRTVGFDHVAILAAAFAALVSAALAFWVWEGHPHISDEISFLFQAKYFAEGWLVAPGVPVPEAFDAYQIQCSAERCISVLQPGWPALLAVGVRSGTPWLVNPLFAGVNLLLVFTVVRELRGQRLARGATLLLATSPWYLFLGMSFMTHQATLFGALIGAAGTTLACRQRSVLWAAVAGAGVGLASLVRPMDGVIAAAVVGLPLLLTGPPRRRIAAVALFIVGTAALGSVNLAYNHAITGNPLDFPVTSYVNELWGEGTNNLGFGPDRGVFPLWSHMDGFPGHSPFQAVVNAGLNLTAIHVELFGWLVGSLLPLLLLIVWWEMDRMDWWMFLSIAVIVAAYSLYWFASGPDFAARYWFLAIVPLVMLSARGLVIVARRLPAVRGRNGMVAVATAVALLTLQGLFVFIPWRSTDKYYRYFGTAPFVREILRNNEWPPGVYLVGGGNQPDYAAAMIYTAPDLAGGSTVFAFDSLPGRADELRAAFPGRTIWRVAGPTVTGAGYQILGESEGPPVGPRAR